MITIKICHIIKNKQIYYNKKYNNNNKEIFKYKIIYKKENKILMY